MKNMHDWKYPNKDILPKELSETSNETISKMEIEIKTCNEHNEKIWASILERHKEMMEIASSLYGANSNPVKYLRKQSINHPSRFSFSDFKRSVEDSKKEKISKNKIYEDDNKKRELTMKAINWLTERDYVLSEDFNIDNAIKFANDIAFDEEIIKRTKEIEETGIFTTFNGDDYCENCSGWDGISRRCECEKRRVYWDCDFYDDYFLEPHIYGQAD